MPDTPLRLDGFPRAILHVDGDAFFTSVEQAVHPEWRGRPMVTGKERGIIACASYEAKALGIARGLPLFEARKLCPGLLIVPSDYETYSLYSKRMFNILRDFTPCVEEYSIDEAFADITGMRRVFRCGYEEIARRLQQAVRDQLGITVSVGLSLSKSLAKLGSKFRKPAGFTAVAGRHLHLLLQRTPLARVWGFGPNSVSLLEKLGLRTAYDYVQRPEAWAGRLLHKPGREIWTELRGESVWKVATEEKSAYATIVKSKTFTPPTGDQAYVFARLLRNVEAALAKARRHRLRPRVLGVVLRHHDFRHDGLEARLNRATASTPDLLPLVRAMFEKVFRADARYRATLIVLGGLEDDRAEQFELFEDRPRIDALRRLTEAMDDINARYGRHAVRSGTALFLDRQPPCPRDEPPARLVRPPLQGETARQRLCVPQLQIAV